MCPVLSAISCMQAYEKQVLCRVCFCLDLHSPGSAPPQVGGTPQTGQTGGGGQSLVRQRKRQQTLVSTIQQRRLTQCCAENKCCIAWKHGRPCAVLFKNLRSTSPPHCHLATLRTRLHLAPVVNMLAHVDTNPPFALHHHLTRPTPAHARRAPTLTVVFSLLIKLTPTYSSAPAPQSFPALSRTSQPTAPHQCPPRALSLLPCPPTHIHPPALSASSLKLSRMPGATPSPAYSSAANRDRMWSIELRGRRGGGGWGGKEGGSHAMVVVRWQAARMFSERFCKTDEPMNPSVLR